MKKTDVVIIGAGPAGLTAALYASRAGAQVIIVESGAPGGKLNLTAEIENYTGIKKIMGPQLAYDMYEHGLSFGATFEMAEVTGVTVEGDKKIVHLGDDTIEAKAVIIATGTKERKMNIPGEAEMTGRGVSYCAVCDGPFYRGKEVAVIGGGNSAIEEATYLSTIVDKVHVVMRRDVFRADKIISDKALAADNIVFHYKKKPAEVLYEDRTLIPVSSTQIHADPFRYWEYIPEIVRPHFVKTVLLVGGESTGKSTLTEKRLHAFGLIVIHLAAECYKKHFEHISPSNFMQCIFVTVL